MAIKSLLKSSKLSHYIHEQSKHSLTAVQKELLAVTDAMPESHFKISVDQGAFLAFLVKAIKARKIIEIGTFTGYSALCMGLALPSDGQLLTCDVNQQWAQIAEHYWEKAQVADKITQKLKPALETIKELKQDPKNLASFDLAFIDADKENNYNYYDQLLELLKPGALVLIDNALPASSKDGEYSDHQNQTTLVEAVQKDLRTISCFLTIGAGFLGAIKI